jgi:hypothetical protein
MKMSSETKKPVILLAFANEPTGARGYLCNLGEPDRALSVLALAPSVTGQDLTKNYED